MISFKERKNNILHKIICLFVAVTFVFTMLVPPQARAQGILLPNPGVMVPPSAGYLPVMVKGITVHPENPLEFDFIINNGETGAEGEELKKESKKLVKYFLASLTVPEKDLWVNLSPYEKDRVIPDSFGLTEMGRDLLAQDYILKQLTSTMMYPEDELGEAFWGRVYEKALEKFGTTDIPLDTFNKIWIVPEKATIYQKGNSAYVVENKLKVMLEADYVAMQHVLKGENSGSNIETFSTKANQSSIVDFQSSIIKDVLIPAITKEVNEGKNFASLRQMANSIVLASWYKQNLKESLLGQVYVDQAKTKGIEHNVIARSNATRQSDEIASQKALAKTSPEEIYDQYLEAFNTGVYNYIKEEYDSETQQIIPRKYFSGGVTPQYFQNSNTKVIYGDKAMTSEEAVLAMDGTEAPSGTSDSEITVVLAEQGKGSDDRAEDITQAMADGAMTAISIGGIRNLIFDNLGEDKELQISDITDYMQLSRDSRGRVVAKKKIQTFILEQYDFFILDARMLKLLDDAIDLVLQELGQKADGLQAEVDQIKEIRDRFSQVDPAMMVDPERALNLFIDNNIPLVTEKAGKVLEILRERQFDLENIKAITFMVQGMVEFVTDHNVSIESVLESVPEDDENIDLYRAMLESLPGNNSVIDSIIDNFKTVGLPINADNVAEVRAALKKMTYLDEGDVIEQAMIYLEDLSYNQPLFNKPASQYRELFEAITRGFEGFDPAMAVAPKDALTFFKNFGISIKPENEEKVLDVLKTRQFNRQSLIYIGFTTKALESVQKATEWPIDVVLKSVPEDDEDILVYKALLESKIHRAMTSIDSVIDDLKNGGLPISNNNEALVREALEEMDITYFDVDTVIQMAEAYLYNLVGNDDVMLHETPSRYLYLFEALVMGLQDDDPAMTAKEVVNAAIADDRVFPVQNYYYDKLNGYFSRKDFKKAMKKVDVSDKELLKMLKDVKFAAVRNNDNSPVVNIVLKGEYDVYYIDREMNTVYLPENLINKLGSKLEMTLFFLALIEMAVYQRQITSPGVSSESAQVTADLEREKFVAAYAKRFPVEIDNMVELFIDKIKKRVKRNKGLIKRIGANVDEDLLRKWESGDVPLGPWGEDGPVVYWENRKKEAKEEINQDSKLLQRVGIDATTIEPNENDFAMVNRNIEVTFHSYRENVPDRILKSFVKKIIARKWYAVSVEGKTLEPIKISPETVFVLEGEPRIAYNRNNGVMTISPELLTEIASHGENMVANVVVRVVDSDLAFNELEKMQLPQKVITVDLAMSAKVDVAFAGSNGEFELNQIGKPVVLMVEDDPMLVDLYGRVLERLKGFDAQVVLAKDLYSALKVVDGAARELRFIISDGKFPSIDAKVSQAIPQEELRRLDSSTLSGIHLMNIVKKELEVDVPIVMLSSQEEGAFYREGNVHPDEYIFKAGFLLLLKFLMECLTDG